MKRFTIIISFALIILQTQAQDYLISFAGTGDTTIVETVKVDNLTSGATLTLNGGDTLHLTTSVGINTPDKDDGNIQIYPNPMEGQSTLTFVAPENGGAVISIVDFSGKTVCQTSTLLSPGRHSFRISGIGRGIYFVKVSGNNYFYSAKLISHSSMQSRAEIEYIPSIRNPGGNPLKSIASTIDMPYTSYDQLLFKGTSGQYSTVVPDMPAGNNKTITFNFAACTDADNNHYTLIQIGAQTWMAENLKVGVRIDGVQEQTNNGIIEKYCYDNDANNCNTYGGLYQWNEMMQYVTTQGIQGICPIGWHIPTLMEWCTVTHFLDLTVDCNDWDLSGIYAGGKMKSTGTIEAGTGLWYSPNTGATNESGFSAVPAGFRYTNGTFSGISGSGFWWSSYRYNTVFSYYWNMVYNTSGISGSYYYASHGFSVRCLRDL